MRNFLISSLLSVALLFGCAGDRLKAQSGPNPSTPGWLVPITTDPGNTRWGWNAVTLSSPLPVQPSYLYSNITTDATFVLKTGAGVLHTICFNNPVATETVTVFDNTAGSGTKIGTVTTPASPQPGCLTYDAAFTTGLTVTTGTAAGDLTVSYR